MKVCLAGCGRSRALSGGDEVSDTQAQMVSTSENRVMVAGTASSEGTGKAQTKKLEDEYMKKLYNMTK